MVINEWKVVAGVFMLVPCVGVLAFSVWIVEEIPVFSIKGGRGVLLNSINRIARINS
jgi:hypothetical protein